MIVLRLLCAIAALFGLAGSAAAHSSSNAYLTIIRTGSELDVQWEIALRDLDYAVGLDPAADGALTWGQLRGKQGAIEAYALPRLTLSGDGHPCGFGPTQLLFDRHGGNGYAVLRFAASCGGTPARLTVDYRLLFDLDPQHRGLLKLVSNDAERAFALSPAAPSLIYDVAADTGSTFVQFFTTGNRPHPDRLRPPTVHHRPADPRDLCPQRTVVASRRSVLVRLRGNREDDERVQRGACLHADALGARSCSSAGATDRKRDRGDDHPRRGRQHPPDLRRQALDAGFRLRADPRLRLRQPRSARSICPRARSASR